MNERFPRDDRERGVTVVETLVVLALSAAVMIPLLLLLQGGIRNERQATDRVDALGQGASALEWMAVDVRSATGFSAMRTGVPTGSALLVRTMSNGEERRVEWRFANDELIRTELDDGGQAVTTTVILDGLDETVSSSSVQLLDLEGRILDTAAGSIVDLTRCTSLVRLTIGQRVNGVARVHSTDVAVRSTREIGASC